MDDRRELTNGTVLIKNKHLYNLYIYTCVAGWVVSALDFHAVDPGSIPGLNTWLGPIPVKSEVQTLANLYALADSKRVSIALKLGLRLMRGEQK